jgi:hypothetical protein
MLRVRISEFALAAMTASAFIALFALYQVRSAAIPIIATIPARSIASSVRILSRKKVRRM